MKERDTIAMLLRQAQDALEIRRRWEKKTGGAFNIFSILGMESNEVKTHSRFLYELLDPEGSHRMGDQFLREFFALVLKKPFPEKSPVRIFREYPFSGEDSGRIDLLIEGGDICYPIEVKIYAGDQAMQVRRYAEFASARAKDSQVYYLTLDGHEPSEYSTGAAGGSAVVCLSFAENIRPWLVRCGEIVWSIPVIREAIQQYVNLLDKLTGSIQRDQAMDMIQKMVGSSRESYQSAVAIAEALVAAKTEKMRCVLQDIQAHLEKRIELISKDYKKVDTYYMKKWSNKIPCLKFKVTKQDTYILVLSVSVGDDYLFFDLSAEDKKLNPLKKKTNQLLNAFPGEEWKEWLSSFEYQKDYSWLKYLPASAPLDFKTCSGAYIDLFDPQRYAEIMDQIYAELDDSIDALERMGILTTEEKP